MNIESIALAERVERWQKRLLPLGVGSFRIECVTLCDETTSKGGAIASARIPPHYDSVKFEFTNDFLEEADGRRLDEIIVHEWLHVAHRDTDEAMRQVEPWMPEHTYADWLDRMEHEHEGFIDRLARYIVQVHYGDPPRLA